MTTTLFGCTGLVGSHILTTLLAAESCTTVQTISRRSPKSTGAKLQAVVEPNTSLWTDKLASLSPAPTTVISALGTTRAAAGSIENQWKIDHNLNVDIAREAKTRGVRNFVFISSAGTRGLLADRAPYSRMKQGVEDTVRDLGFDHAVILRPGLILGQREQDKHLGWLLNPAVRAIGRIAGGWAQDMLGQEAEVIARAAVHAAKLAEQGKAPSKYWILEAKDVIRLGRTEWKD